MTRPRILDRDTFDRLARHRGWPSYSVTIPTAHKGAEIEQLPISLKNARVAIGATLDEHGVASTERDALIQPIRDAEDDHEFWQHQGDTLAVLGSGDGVDMIRLSYSVPAETRVSDRYAVRPLVRALNGTTTPLLALSLHDVRFFTLSRGSLVERPYGGPTSIDDVNWFEDDESRVSAHPIGGGTTGIHGDNPEDRDHESRLRFLRAVGDHVAEAVPEGTSVLVMAVEEHGGPYGESAPHETYGFTVHGSPDGLSAARLLEHAEPALDRIAEERITRIALILDDARSAGRYEEDPAAIADAALNGRVDTLVLDDGSPAIPASVDEVNLRISLDDSGPLDLLEEATRHTWANGGSVHVLDTVPGSGASIAAALRY